MLIFGQRERGSQNRRSNAPPADHFGGKASRLGGKQNVLQGCTDADPLLMRRDIRMIILNRGDHRQQHRAGQCPLTCRLEYRNRGIGIGSAGGLHEKVRQGMAFVIWDVDQAKGTKTAMIRRCGNG